MKQLIDDFLNTITMYRLALYYLIGILIVALGLSYFNLLSFTPFALITSMLVLILVSYITNRLFSLVYEAPTNFESVFITALILALIITPAKTSADFAFLAWAAILAMASKYILALGNKHIFNPVAVSVALTSLFLNRSASWWVGNLYLVPFVVAGGLLIVRKLQKEDMIFYFLVTAIAMVSFSVLSRSTNLLTVFNQLFLHSPLFFFAAVMLTEPLTTPPTQLLQMAYAVLTGLLYAPNIHLGSLYSTPELALLAGNFFSYLVSPKEKLMLRLSQKVPIAADTYDFIFALDKKLKFSPGQYMEWTLDQTRIDSRGNRRYFTLASSPTEEEVRIGVKLYPQPSSFKSALVALQPGQKIVAGQRAGDFVLPEDKKEKLVFVAGGIGITPYRSMLKYLIDTGDSRDVILLYSNRNERDIVYQDVLSQAQQKLGLKIILTLTDETQVSPTWQGETGRVNTAMILKYIPDFGERTFYLSGPNAMVNGYEAVLKELHVEDKKIKKDFFPGFA